ncbi:DUF309 domain-containing protein [Phocicoccus pinnipedialis]|nr:DUF309 domain-containing protein [Jeotgalicoccus pinnipedialis]
MLIIEQDYFECHEIMEDAWKSKGTFTKMDKEVFLVLIATAEYHYRRDNLNGAKRSYIRALNIFHSHPFNLNSIGLKESFIDLIGERIKEIDDAPFKPLSYPIIDSVFNALYEASDFDSITEFESYLNEIHIKNHETVHRHKIRDRTDVIEERLMALNRKKRD